jgi:hypothetical protein
LDSFFHFIIRIHLRPPDKPIPNHLFQSPQSVKGLIAAGYVLAVQERKLISWHVLAPPLLLNPLTDCGDWVNNSGYAYCLLENHRLWRWFPEESTNGTDVPLIRPPYRGRIKPPALRVVVDFLFSQPG